MTHGAEASAPILYVVVPGFYAFVERRRLALEDDRPILVGGDPRKRGRVQSASPEAEALGVFAGMGMLEALERCPDARRISTDMAHYRSVSNALRASLRREVESLEPEGLAGAFLDLRATPERAPEVAKALVARAEADTGLRVAIGGGPGKGVARMAAESVVSGEIKLVAASDVHAFLDPLPVERLAGVGPRTTATLAELGARSVAELRGLPRAAVEEALGNHGLEILALAEGAEREGVKSTKHPASLSRETALERPVGEGPELVQALGELARALESNLARHDLRAGRIALRLRLGDGRERTRSTTVDAGLQAAPEIASEARALLERFQLGGDRTRGLRLTLAGLSPAGARSRQLDLFG